MWALSDHVLLAFALNVAPWQKSDRGDLGSCDRSIELCRATSEMNYSAVGIIFDCGQIRKVMMVMAGLANNGSPSHAVSTHFLTMKSFGPTF